jgi:hypothetical protein
MSGSVKKPKKDMAKFVPISYYKGNE